MNLKKMSTKDYIIVFLKGILLGLISVGIPGLSASTIGIIVGIYFLMVEAIANVFKDFKHNGLFLLVLILGYGLGAVGAAASITILFGYFPLVTTMVILGFILGSIPDMIIKLKNGFKKPSNLIVFGIVCALLVVYNYVWKSRDEIVFPTEPTFTFLIYITIIGLVTSSTFVIPGVDFAVVFLSLGIYYAFTNMITQLVSFGTPGYLENLVANLEILGFYLIGYFVGIFLFSKLIKFLSKKYDSQTQFASLAFICAAPAIVVKNCIVDNPKFYVTFGQFFVGGALAVFFFSLLLYIGFVSRHNSARHYRAMFTHIHKYMRFKKQICDTNSPNNVTLKEKYFKIQEICNRINVLERIHVNSINSTNNIVSNKGALFIGYYQDRFDYQAIISSCNNPISFIGDYKDLNLFLAKDVFITLNSQNINSITITKVKSIASNLKNGLNYCLLTNKEKRIRSGYLLFAKKAKAPIIPICFYNTEQVYGVNDSHPVDCYVIYLEPIYFEEYQDLSLNELALLIDERIKKAKEDFANVKALETKGCEEEEKNV